jgi:hypothetical protein
MAMMGAQIGASARDGLDVRMGMAAAAIDFMSQAQEVRLVEKCLAEGLFVRSTEGEECANCGSYMTGPFCRKCNQSRGTGELLDQDDDQGDRDVDDHSDSEDADEDRPPDMADEDTLPSEASPPGLAEMLSNFFCDLGFFDGEIALYLYLTEGMLRNEKGIDQSLPRELSMSAADLFGKTEEDLQALWAEKPFNQDDFDGILEEWLGISRKTVSEDFEEPFLEIRKVAGEYLPVVRDLFEDFEPAPGKKTAPIDCNGVQIPAGLFLAKIRQRNQNLLKILDCLITRRRDFLDAPTGDDARRILKERPLEQSEIATITELDKGTISKHFSTKSVLTPHGVFMLGELSSPKSRTGEDITAAAMRDRILEIIKRGDSEDLFYPDQKVVAMLKEEAGISASRETVQKVRKSHGIPNSRERRAKDGELKGLRQGNRVDTG